ncbi:ichor [Anopheles aquasalis]|uniref:ichor n=1 Tax=Anopheles aquasalis TaxID=42839 RepID=UPI00215A3624|nr:ichor [Anopheles aquasalis]
MQIESMVNCKMSSQNDSVEVDNLLMSPCWTQSTSVADQYLLDGHKLLLEAELDSLPSDGETQKSSMDVLENLLLNSAASITSATANHGTTNGHHGGHSHNGHGTGGPGGGGGGGGGLGSGGDVKPLPSFTSFNTSHLSINGISGYHYTAIAQRLPEENNNYTQNSYQNQNGGASGNNGGHMGGGGSGNGNNGVTGSNGSTTNGSNGGNDNNIVSSTSTCLPDSVLNPDGAGPDSGGTTCTLQNVKLFADGSIDDGGGGGGGGGGKIYSAPADSCVMNGADSVSGARIFVDTKELSEYDMSSIEDIAAIIGSAIADTTVPSSKVEKEDGNDTRDSWMDLDAWIEGTCTGVPDAKLIVSQQDSLSELILPHSPVHTSSGTTTTSTLQSLLTHGYMPLLQNRLQNGPPIKLETPSSTSAYCGELISTSTSPPGSVVSTSTDNLILNGRYLQNHQHNHHQQHHHHGYGGLGSSLGSGLGKPDGLCSPELGLSNFPHTTSTSTATNGNSSSSSSTSSSSSSSSNSPTTPKSKRRNGTHSTTKGQQSKSGMPGQPAPGMHGQVSNNLSSGQHQPPTLHQQQQQQQHQQQQHQQQQHQQQHQQLNAQSQQAAALSFQAANDLSGLLGKEKPVHRCNICNRGFLNKSNIKVHLRTHTGEKPFRCEVCAKAFRQKAHLIKHQQIHKRIGRD